MTNIFKIQIQFKFKTESIHCIWRLSCNRLPIARVKCTLLNPTQVHNGEAIGVGGGTSKYNLSVFVVTSGWNWRLTTKITWSRLIFPPSLSTCMSKHVNSMDSATELVHYTFNHPPPLGCHYILATKTLYLYTPYIISPLPPAQLTPSSPPSCK